MRIRQMPENEPRFTCFVSRGCTGIADRMGLFRYPDSQNRTLMSTSRMTKLKLLDLPVEILSEILCHLDHRYILRSSAVRISS
jgi:hypothetical protein